MQVQFNQTVDDIVAFSLFHMKHSPTLRRMRWITTLLIIGLLLLVLCLLRSYEWALYLAIGWIVYIVLLRILPKRHIKKLIKEGQNASMFGPCTVTMSPEGIAKETEVSRFSFRWPSIERIGTTDDYAFVYVNSLSALIVPRRAFGTPSEFAAFVSQVQQYIDTARQSSAGAAGGVV